MAQIIIIFVAVILGWPFICSIFSTTQLFGPIIYRGITDEKLVALTFDDGPNPPFTDNLLEILNKYNVKATFFVVGSNLLRHPQAGKSIVNAGHVIANHSHSHSYFKYFAQPSFTQEINLCQNTIFQITGKKPALFRSPWLFRTPWLLHNVKIMGLTAISGIFGYEFEIFQPSALKIAARALEKIYPGSILIFHDGYEASSGNRTQTVEAINLLIPKLLNQGYKFVTVDQLLQIKPYQN